MRSSSRITGCITLGIYCLLGSAVAQQNGNTPRAMTDLGSLESVWNSYYSKVPDDQLQAVSAAESIDLISIGRNELKKNYADEIDHYLTVLDKSNQKIPGLEVTGNYLNNFNPDYNDEGQAVFLRNRLQVGMNWNILKDGVIENRNNLRLEKQRLILKKLMIEPDAISAQQAQKIDTLKAIINAEKIKWLELKSACLKAQMPSYISLTANYAALKETLLKLIAQSVQAETELINCRAYNTFLTPVSNGPATALSLPVLELSPEFMYFIRQMEDGNKRCKTDSILAVTQLMLKEESHFGSQMRLQAFFRYNYFDRYRPSVVAPQYFSTGVSLVCPLVASRKKTDQLNLEKIQLLKSELEFRNAKEGMVYHTLLNLYEDYKKARVAYSELKGEEELSRYKLGLQELRNKKYNQLFSPVDALEELGAFYDLQLQLIDTKFELYTILFKMQLSDPFIDLHEYVDTLKKAEGTTNVKKERLEKRNSVYIWSNAVESHSAKTILAFLKTNNFDEVIISMKKEGAYQERLYHLIDTLSSNAIKIQLMISNNELLQVSKANNYLKKQCEGFLATVNTKITAIHLDVEPHAMNDWQQKRELYKQTYLNLLQQAKELGSTYHLELNVSIPVFYDEPFLKKIYAQCNYVYIMAYEIKDLEKLKKKISEEFTISKNRSVIAIRANDFGSVKEMLIFSNELKKSEGVNRIAFQSLDRMMKP